MSESDFSALRERMVVEQLERRGIDDQRVLSALRSLPRHAFVLDEDRAFAYEDRPLSIGAGQTISQPYVVALMTQLLALEGNETVLEIGTGSGYQTALLASLANEVHSVERVETLANTAKERFDALEIPNVHVHVGDGSRGWPEEAPYEAILVTAGAPRAPKPLFAQLAEGGRLVIPVGRKGGQILQRWRREGKTFKREDLSPVAFVPLIGRHGWDR
ncbi:MAG: protein-L-isoaspartate(D-aspartate) O-methyltransferase [Chloroflexi bacterium]|nr:protein-L-isoaspartate(D-aspartate) O-methyltransferase [Chloroflexota bacterium]